MDCYPDFHYYSFSYPDNDSHVLDFYQNASITWDIGCVYLFAGVHQEAVARDLFSEVAE